MPVRRPIHGHPLLVGGPHPLLVVAAGALAACSPGPGKHAPVGNLMAPQEPLVREVCVRAVPPDAAITVDGASLADEACATVSGEVDSVVVIEVSAPGFATERQEPRLTEISGVVTVELEPLPVEAGPLEPLEPRGNLMAPPAPPPRR